MELLAIPCSDPNEPRWSVLAPAPKSAVLPTEPATRVGIKSSLSLSCPYRYFPFFITSVAAGLGLTGSICPLLVARTFFSLRGFLVNSMNPNTNPSVSGLSLSLGKRDVDLQAEDTGDVGTVRTTVWRGNGDNFRHPADWVEPYRVPWTYPDW